MFDHKIHASHKGYPKPEIIDELSMSYIMKPMVCETKKLGKCFHNDTILAVLSPLPV